MDKEYRKKAIEDYLDDNPGMIAALFVFLLLGALCVCIGVGFLFGAGWGFAAFGLACLAEYLLAVRNVRKSAAAKKEAEEPCPGCRFLPLDGDPNRVVCNECGTSFDAGALSIDGNTPPDRCPGCNRRVSR